MPVKSDPTLGWRQRNVAEIILLVTARQKREMGQRVAHARDAKGMTNESLARRSGLSVKTVSRFVNGQREPREHTIKSLAKALGITAEEIRGSPPAPLGLGAREEQVNDMAVEFRGYVAKILEALAEARTERAGTADLVRQQSENLRRQEGILRELTRVVGELPDDENLRRFNAAARQLTELAAADEARPPGSHVERASTDRRQASGQ